MLFTIMNFFRRQLVKFRSFRKPSRSRIYEISEVREYELVIFVIGVAFCVAILYLVIN